jgi:hypothetical protein
MLLDPTGTSTTYDENNNLEYWRNWWMTAGVEDDNGIPVRDENDEIEGIKPETSLSSPSSISLFRTFADDSPKSLLITR